MTEHEQIRHDLRSLADMIDDGTVTDTTPGMAYVLDNIEDTLSEEEMFDLMALDTPDLLRHLAWSDERNPEQVFMFTRIVDLVQEFVQLFPTDGTAGAA